MYFLQHNNVSFQETDRGGPKIGSRIREIIKSQYSAAILHLKKYEGVLQGHSTMKSIRFHVPFFVYFLQTPLFLNGTAYEYFDLYAHKYSIQHLLRYPWNGEFSIFCINSMARQELMGRHLFT